MLLMFGLISARGGFGGRCASYNHEHRRSGIGLDVPASVLSGTATEIRAKRAVTRDGAVPANRAPSPPELPTGVWINNPTIETDAQENGRRIAMSRHGAVGPT